MGIKTIGVFSVLIWAILNCSIASIVSNSLSIVSDRRSKLNFIDEFENRKARKGINDYSNLLFVIYARSKLYEEDLKDSEVLSSTLRAAPLQITSKKNLLDAWFCSTCEGSILSNVIEEFPIVSADNDLEAIDYNAGGIIDPYQHLNHPPTIYSPENITFRSPWQRAYVANVLTPINNNNNNESLLSTSISAASPTLDAGLYNSTGTTINPNHHSLPASTLNSSNNHLDDSITPPTFVPSTSTEPSAAASIITMTPVISWQVEEVKVQQSETIAGKEDVISSDDSFYEDDHQHVAAVVKAEKDDDIIVAAAAAAAAARIKTQQEQEDDKNNEKMVSEKTSHDSIESIEDDNSKLDVVSVQSSLVAIEEEAKMKEEVQEEQAEQQQQQQLVSNIVPSVTQEDDAEKEAAAAAEVEMTTMILEEEIRTSSSSQDERSPFPMVVETTSASADVAKEGEEDDIMMEMEEVREEVKKEEEENSLSITLLNKTLDEEEEEEDDVHLLSTEETQQQRQMRTVSAVVENELSLILGLQQEQQQQQQQQVAVAQQQEEEEDANNAIHHDVEEGKEEEEPSSLSVATVQQQQQQQLVVDNNEKISDDDLSATAEESDSRKDQDQEEQQQPLPSPSLAVVDATIVDHLSNSESSSSSPIGSLQSSVLSSDTADSIAVDATTDHEHKQQQQETHLSMVNENEEVEAEEKAPEEEVGESISSLDTDSKKIEQEGQEEKEEGERDHDYAEDDVVSLIATPTLAAEEVIPVVTIQPRPPAALELMMDNSSSFSSLLSIFPIQLQSSTSSAINITYFTYLAILLLISTLPAIAFFIFYQYIYHNFSSPASSLSSATSDSSSTPAVDPIQLVYSMEEESQRLFAIKDFHSAITMLEENLPILATYTTSSVSFSTAALSASTATETGTLTSTIATIPQIDLLAFQHYLARAYMATGQYNLALPLLQLVLAGYMKQGEDVHLAQVYEDLAYIHYHGENKDYPEALQALQESLRIYLEDYFYQQSSHYTQSATAAAAADTAANANGDSNTEVTTALNTTDNTIMTTTSTTTAHTAYTTANNLLAVSFISPMAASSASALGGSMPNTSGGINHSNQDDNQSPSSSQQHGSYPADMQSDEHDEHDMSFQDIYAHNTSHDSKKKLLFEEASPMIDRDMVSAKLPTTAPDHALIVEQHQQQQGTSTSSASSMHDLNDAFFAQVDLATAYKELQETVGLDSSCSPSSSSCSHDTDDHAEGQQLLQQLPSASSTASSQLLIDDLQEVITSITSLDIARVCQKIADVYGQLQDVAHIKQFEQFAQIITANHSNKKIVERKNEK